MNNNESGSSFVLDTRVTFLHNIKKLARLEQTDIEKKKGILMGLCQILISQGLGISYLKNDMPDSESSILREEFISETYHALNLRHDFGNDLINPEIYGGREKIIQVAYNDIREIFDRAIVRYERMVEIINASNLGKKYVLKV